MRRSRPSAEAIARALAAYRRRPAHVRAFATGLTLRMRPHRRPRTTPPTWTETTVETVLAVSWKVVSRVVRTILQRDPITGGMRPASRTIRHA